jgi:hypothetical protein
VQRIASVREFRVEHNAIYDRSGQDDKSNVSGRSSVCFCFLLVCFSAETMQSQRTFNLVRMHAMYGRYLPLYLRAVNRASPLRAANMSGKGCSNARINRHIARSIGGQTSQRRIGHLDDLI